MDFHGDFHGEFDAVGFYLPVIIFAAIGAALFAVFVVLSIIITCYMAKKGTWKLKNGKWNWKPAEVGGGDSWGGDWRSGGDCGGRCQGDVGRGGEEDYKTNNVEAPPNKTVSQP